jgi:signal transduction histidine kinase
MKRVVVPATIAVGVLVCVAVGVWLAIARGVAATAAAQGQLAATLLDGNVPIGDDLARTLSRPGLHILLADPATRIVIDAPDDGIHPLPPGSAARGEPPAEGQAPPAEAPPPLDGRPPPPGPPRARPQGPLDSLVLALVHMPPLVVKRGTRVVRITPDIRRLETWLGLDALGFGAGIVLVGGLGAARALANGRAERAALEARIVERREAAERYQRFLAETGHELRTPLTVLTGYIDILRGRAPEEPLDARIIEGMHAEASRMRTLVDKMMTLARLEAHVGVPRLLDIATAAREAAQTVQRRYPDRTIAVNARQTASIVIDADDFAVALGNVLENAVKYAPDSPIEIETTIGDGFATTAIIDHGTGILPSDQVAIFERFNRGRKRGFGEGLGLGLAIVKRIVDRWDGRVDCESEPGRTVFRLSFPLADEEHDGPVR